MENTLGNSTININDRIKDGFLFLLFAGVSSSISATGLATAGLFITTLVGIVLYREKIPNAIFNYGFALMLITALISVAVSADFATNAEHLRKYWRFILPICVMMALIRKNSLPMQLNVLCFVTSVIAILGVAQHFTGLNITGNKLYLYENSSNLKRWHALGLFSHHLTFAGVLLLIFPVFLSAWFCKKLSRIKRGLYLFGCLLMLAAIVFSLGRSAWISSVVVIFVVLILNKRKYEIILAILAIIGLTAGYNYLLKSGLIYSEPLFQRFVSVLDSPDRLKMIDAALMVIKEHIWFGIGPNTINPLEEAYRIIAETRGSIHNAASVGVHNIYLQLVLNYGVFHLLAFILLWLGIFTAGFTALMRKSAGHIKESYILKGILAGFLGSLVMGLAENNFYDGEIQQLIMLWIGVAGFVIYQIRSYKKDRL